VSNLEQLAREFEANRSRLRAVAVRMLGSVHDAEDVVQEAWLRLGRADTEAVDNLGGWLTTVVARMCLDALRQRGRRPEVAAGAAPDPEAGEVATPEDDALLADSVGAALLVVLDTLEPAERLAFVLHDMFALPFEEIAPIVGRTPVAARQLASRARRRVRSDPVIPEHEAAVERDVVAVFLAAARRGDFGALLRLLDPEVVVRADRASVEMAAARASAGAPSLEAEMRGPDAVARVFAGGARAARPALVDGLAGAVVSVGGRPLAAFSFTVIEGRVSAIELVADPQTLGSMVLEPLSGRDPASPIRRGSAATRRQEAT